jgi:Tfp pilus assembly protein PilO
MENNIKINLEFSNLLILYKHYKDYLLPFGIILVCVLIIFVIIVPQFQQYFNSQEDLKAQNAKLQVLKYNYNFLLNLSDTQANSDFTSLSHALPAGKDFSGIMNAVSFVSAKTGVSVGDFNFSLGDLSGKSTNGVSAYPSIKIDVNVVGNPQQIMKFVGELYKTAPIAEVTTIKSGGSSGVVSILFYYKPFPPQTIDETAPIVSLPSSELSLVKNVSLWNNTVDQSQGSIIPSSAFSDSSAATPSASGQNTNPF